ncbi:hypothetical protein ACFPIJ_35535 [Dactylosporangium cerinum]|uniref:DUF1877 family protein n=1 Tax=Dactylosporangium cerinum TaxID=1434730 RepID=A0ABV9W388_9ACTN
MGMLTDYFVATADRAAALAEDGPCSAPDLPILEMKGVEPWVLGSKLWAIIEGLPADNGDHDSGNGGDGVPFDLDRCDAGADWVATAGDSRVVVRLADGFVAALTALPDERVPGVSSHWARSEEWGGDIEPGELDETVLALRDLARQAVAPDLHLYVWVCS